MILLDLPYEVLYHILGYNLLPRCLLVCKELYSIEMDLIPSRISESKFHYPFLDSPFYHNDVDGYLFILNYTNREISDIYFVIRSLRNFNLMEGEEEIQILIDRYRDRGKVKDICWSLYSNYMNSLISTLASVTREYEDIAIVATSNHDLSTVKEMIERGADNYDGIYIESCNCHCDTIRDHVYSNYYGLYRLF